MSRRYDSRTTIFSPEGLFIHFLHFKDLAGRLYQVEYAMEAISHAGSSLGILSTQGIVLAAEKKVSSHLLEQISHEKLYPLSE